MSHLTGVKKEERDRASKANGRMGVGEIFLRATT